MEFFTIISFKVLMFVILMLIGVYAAYRKILTQNNISVLSGLLVNIAMPCLNFSLLYEQQTTLASILKYWKFIIGEFSISIVLCFAGLLIAGLMHLKNTTRNVHILLTMCGNQGFMGIPLIMALFSEGRSEYIPIFTLIDQFLFWTFGVYVLSRHKNNKKFNAKLLLGLFNPMVISMILALLCNSFGIRIPAAAAETLSALGNTCFSWALIYLGASLCFCGFGKEKLKIKPITSIIIIKMIILPVIVYHIAGIFMEEVPQLVLTIIAAVPSMSSLSMLAYDFDSDGDYATQGIFVTTIASIITIPFVFFLISV